MHYPTKVSPLTAPKPRPVETLPHGPEFAETDYFQPDENVTVETRTWIEQPAQHETTYPEKERPSTKQTALPSTPIIAQTVTQPEQRRFSTQISELTTDSAVTLGSVVERESPEFDFYMPQQGTVSPDQTVHSTRSEIDFRLVSEKVPEFQREETRVESTSLKPTLEIFTEEVTITRAQVSETPRERTETEDVVLQRESPVFDFYLPQYEKQSVEEVRPTVEETFVHFPKKETVTVDQIEKVTVANIQPEETTVIQRPSFVQTQPQYTQDISVPRRFSTQQSELTTETVTSQGPVVERESPIFSPQQERTEKDIRPTPFVQGKLTLQTRDTPGVLGTLQTPVQPMREGQETVTTVVQKKTVVETRPHETLPLHEHAELDFVVSPKPTDVSQLNIQTERFFVEESARYTPLPFLHTDMPMVREFAEFDYAEARPEFPEYPEVGQTSFPVTHPEYDQGVVVQPEVPEERPRTVTFLLPQSSESVTTETKSETTLVSEHVPYPSQPGMIYIKLRI